MSSRKTSVAFIAALLCSPPILAETFLPFLNVSATNANTNTNQQTTPIIYGYQVIASLPHDTNSFTQGLHIEDNILFEGTGKKGVSKLARINLSNGITIQAQALDKQFFGEGITVLKDKIYQLSWRSQQGFIYDKSSLRLLSTFRYSGEGWGLTHNNKQLIMSDGSAQLRFLNPSSFKVEKTLTVKSQGQKISRLNELEWVDGHIMANIWHSDWLAIIDADSGEVVASVNLSNLLPLVERRQRTDVLNGIAYDHKKNNLWVTGKYWPKLYQIKLIELPVKQTEAGQ